MKTETLCNDYNHHNVQNKYSQCNIFVTIVTSTSINVNITNNLKRTTVSNSYFVNNNNENLLYSSQDKFYSKRVQS